MIRNSAFEMAGKLASGEITSVQLTQAHLDQISAVDTDVHAFLHVDTEGARAQAAPAPRPGRLPGVAARRAANVRCTFPQPSAQRSRRLVRGARSR